MGMLVPPTGRVAAQGIRDAGTLILGAPGCACRPAHCGHRGSLTTGLLPITRRSHGKAANFTVAICNAPWNMRPFHGTGSRQEWQRRGQT